MSLRIPEESDAEVRIGDRTVPLTNLAKMFWPESGIAKRMLLQWYARCDDTDRPDIDNVPEPVEWLGDLWKPLLARTDRFRLEEML